MTIDQAMKKINEASPFKVLEVADQCIDQLSAEDQFLAGGDLEESAIIIAGSIDAGSIAF